MKVIASLFLFWRIATRKHLDTKTNDSCRSRFCSDVLSGFSCPQNWHYYNENCYYTSDSGDKVDQATAHSKCNQTAGADLASIDDQAEMDFVLSISYALNAF